MVLFPPKCFLGSNINNWIYKCLIATKLFGFKYHTQISRVGFDTFLRCVFNSFEEWIKWAPASRSHNRFVCTGNESGGCDTRHRRGSCYSGTCEEKQNKKRSNTNWPNWQKSKSHQRIPGTNKVLSANLAVDIDYSVSEKSNHVPDEERQVAVVGTSVAEEPHNFLILQNVVVDGRILILRVFKFIGPLLIVRVNFDGVWNNAVDRLLGEFVGNETHQTTFHFQDV